MKFKVLRGSPRKGGWCPSPAPRELGFESPGRHCACLGATLTAVSSPEGQPPWYPENLAPVRSTDCCWGAGGQAWMERHYRGRILSRKSHLCKPHKDREEAVPPPRDSIPIQAPMASCTQ